MIFVNGRFVEKQPSYSYAEYLQSSHWEARRQEILIRDKFKCTRCNSEFYAELHVHHLNYDNLWNEKDEDLITLCKECHAKEHGKDCR